MTDQPQDASPQAAPPQADAVPPAPTTSRADTAAASSASAKRWVAPTVAFMLGAPLFGLLIVAFVDGFEQKREAPLRAVLSNEVYEALQAGETTPTHYLGRTLTSPDFSLPDRDGKAWRLKDHLGKTIVLNFWSVTCKPCLEEMPSLIELGEVASEWGDTEVVTVTIDEDWQTVAPVFRKRPPFPVLFDPKRKIVKDKYGTKMYPETWIIDKKGVIRLRIDGPRNWSSALMLDVISLYR